MRDFILFHMLFLLGGVLLIVGVLALSFKAGDWTRAALGEESRLARAIAWLSGILLVGGALFLAVRVYLFFGPVVWASAGRYWHSQGLIWRRIWRAFFG